MVRTQIYLTENERSRLTRMADVTGKKQSELIREAVDRYLDLATGHRRDKVLQAAGGLWKNRKDLPDFNAVRRSWDRE